MKQPQIERLLIFIFGLKNFYLLDLISFHLASLINLIGKKNYL